MTDYDPAPPAGDVWTTESNGDVRLRLTHSPATGTLLLGTSRGDGTAEQLKEVQGARWRWSPNIDGDGAWYIQRSRGRRVYTGQIHCTVEVLRRHGRDVEVLLGDEKRPMAEQEAERAARAADRVDGLTARSVALRAAGEAGWAAAREFARRWPLGQPILVGHHSEGRHRRDLAMLGRMDEKAIEQLKGAEDAQDRAAAAAANQRHRENGATTQRRIAKLEADLRRAQRGMTVRSPHASDEECAADAAHLSPIAADLEERLAYWRDYLAGLVDAGVYRVWGPEDFAKGDYVAHRWGWSEVLRVGKKSITIPHPFDELAEHGDTATVSYDRVTGQRPAAEHAAAAAAKNQAAAVAG